MWLLGEWVGEKAGHPRYDELKEKAEKGGLPPRIAGSENHAELTNVNTLSLQDLRCLKSSGAGSSAPTEELGRFRQQ